MAGNFDEIVERNFYEIDDRSANALAQLLPLIPVGTVASSSTKTPIKVNDNSSGIFVNQKLQNCSGMVVPPCQTLGHQNCS